MATVCLPLLFANSTTRIWQCVCSWIPAGHKRKLDDQPYIWNWNKISGQKDVPWGQCLQTSLPSSPASYPTRWCSCRKKYKSHSFIFLTWLWIKNIRYQIYASQDNPQITKLQQSNSPKVKLARVKFDQHIFAVLHNELHKNRLGSVIPDCCCGLPGKADHICSYNHWIIANFRMMRYEQVNTEVGGW